MRKKYVCCTPYPSKHTSFNWVGVGGKGQKMAQNDQKIFVPLHISGTVPHMIVVFGTHV